MARQTKKQTRKQYSKEYKTEALTLAGKLGAGKKHPCDMQALRSRLDQIYE